MGGRKDQDVVEVDNTEKAEISAERVLNKRLKDSRGIGEGHDKVLIKALRSVEGVLPLIAFANADEVECIPEINDRENLAVTSLIEEVVDVGNRVRVFLGDWVKASIIDA